MDLQQNQEPISSPLPVLPRLDRLDHLNLHLTEHEFPAMQLQLLEEKHKLAGRRHTPELAAAQQTETEYQRKALYAALDEVHRKGTLVERVEMIENRVLLLQMNLDMDEQDSSRSSSSTIPVSEKGVQTIKTYPDSPPMEENSAQTTATSPENRHIGRKQRRKSGRKLGGWFWIGC
ncbi:hypothetical protein U1Q18_039932 [Sarracenia purpurea var. burkii]